MPDVHSFVVTTEDPNREHGLDVEKYIQGSTDLSRCHVLCIVCVNIPENCRETENGE